MCIKTVFCLCLTSDVCGRQDQRHHPTGIYSMNTCIKKCITTITVIVTFLWSMGLVFITIPINVAYAVSAVLGADSDTTGAGVDGRDFSVSWTPGTQPSGYAETKIYILPSPFNNVSTTTPSSVNTGCSNKPQGVCTALGFFNQFAQSSFVIPQFQTQDSDGTNFAAGNYKACVYVQATTPTLDCSNAFTVTSDTVADAMPPFVNHMPVHTAFASTQAVINAMIFDDQTTAAQFANTGDGGTEYFKLYYATSTWKDSASSV